MRLLKKKVYVLLISKKNSLSFSYWMHVRTCIRNLNFSFFIQFTLLLTHSLTSTHTHKCIPPYNNTLCVFLSLVVLVVEEAWPSALSICSHLILIFLSHTLLSLDSFLSNSPLTQQNFFLFEKNEMSFSFHFKLHLLHLFLFVFVGHCFYHLRHTHTHTSHTSMVWRWRQ